MPAPSHRICLSLNLGWGYGSGFYFGISAGVGIEGGAYAGISIGYDTSGSFSFSASAGIAGFYVSGGYDTKGGWNGSAGWSAPLPSLGIVSFNTNMLGVSGSYSQNGGWSYNHMGVQINKSGMSFSPSVGVGMNLKWGKEVFTSEYLTDNASNNDEPIPFIDDKEFNEWVDNNIKREDFGLEITSAFNDLNEKIGNYRYWRHTDGKIYEINLKTLKYTVIGGMTVVKHNGWSKASDIFMSRFNSCKTFTAVFNHELIHAYHYSIGLHHALGKRFNSYTEHVAYDYYLRNGYNSNAVKNMYNSTTTSVFNMIYPPYLIPLPNK